MEEPRPEVAAAARALFQASALLDPIRLRLWDDDSLTVTQMRLLGHLLEDEPMSNADLAERLYVTRPSVSALLERLERGGYIRREVAPNDRRGICIWLEPRGREVVESLRQETREYAAGLMDGMSEAELEEFTHAVSTFVASGRARRARDLASENAPRGDGGAA
jgi:DNA-binding MarR family transcriptional regulator